jgi:8-oxo-dGTP pyrophosphatase MutT (NUDIX family)
MRDMKPARLKFHVVGQFARGQVTTRWVPETRPRIPEVEADIEQAWDRASRRPGVRLIDLPMCRLESFQANQKLELSLSLTTYKAFLGTNYAHPELVHEFGPKILANPLGISAMIQTSDDFFLLGRRNASVAHYPGRAHPFAGTLEPAEADNVFAAMERELAEEIRITPSEITSINCLGLVEDSSIGQPELIFHARSDRARALIEQSLDESEHSGTFAITSDAATVRKTVDDPLLTPVAAGALLLCGREIFGTQWFDEASAAVTVSHHGL